jgi:integrase
MKLALTKTVIDRAPTRSRAYVLWDSNLQGFGCRVHPSGRRTFIVQYRLRGSRKSYQPTIGEYGTLTLAQARQQAAGMLAAARFGADPQAERKDRAAREAAAAKQLTVAQLIEQYLTALRAGAVKTRRRHGGALASTYIADTERYLRRFAAKYGALPAAEIDRGMHVLPFLDKLASQPAVHRHSCGSLHRLYAWARQRRQVAIDPTEDIFTRAPAGRERSLTLAELARLWHAADSVGGVHGDAIKLLIATGQRRDEVADLPWGEIDLASARWTLPPGRTKAHRQHVLPLPGLAIEVLTGRLGERRQPPPRDELVLPTLSRDGRRLTRISGWTWLKDLLEKKSGVTDWRLHDLRRSFVTICAEHGADIGTLDSMLNHAASGTRGGVIGVYQRATLLEPARQVMLLWDSLLREAIGLWVAMKPDEKIVALAAR